MTVLFVVATILLVILVEALVLRSRRHRAGAPADLPAAMRPPHPPHGLFLDPAHAWVRLGADGSLRVGADDFVAEALGRVEAVEPAPLGSKLERGAPLATFRLAGGRRVTLRAPADGEVVAVNATALESPDAVTSDPYGVGWLVALWPRDHKQAIAPLFLGAGAAAFARQELQRLAEFFGGARAADGALVMADGGVPVRGAVATLSETELERFEREFLASSGR
jgi:glycine cleavage system H protein